jgi:hypothetical protein
MFSVYAIGADIARRLVDEAMSDHFVLSLEAFTTF